MSLFLSFIEINNFHITYMHTYIIFIYIIFPLILFLTFSIGSLEFYYGEVSHCKSLPTSASETELIVAKAGKCLSIMVLASIIFSQCLRLSRKKFILHFLVSSLISVKMFNMYV